MAHLFIVVVYDSFNRNNIKISKTYNSPDFSFFMSQDDAHYHNHQNAPGGLHSENKTFSLTANMNSFAWKLSLDAGQEMVVPFMT